MPSDIRMKKIAAFFQQELSRIISRDLKNPVFANKVITIADVKVSRDLSTARVAVSVLGNEEELHDVIDALNSAEALIRADVMHVSSLRRVPVFTFFEDRTMETASKIDKILDSLDIPPEEPEESGEE
jgi:ribosome-binding factor A